MAVDIITIRGCFKKMWFEGARPSPRLEAGVSEANSAVKTVKKYGLQPLRLKNHRPKKGF